QPAVPPLTLVTTGRDPSGLETAPVLVPAPSPSTTTSSPVITNPASVATVSQSAYTISGMAPPNSTVQLWPAFGGAKTSGAQALGAAVVGSAGIFSVTVPLVVGANEFVATTLISGTESAVAVVPTINQSVAIQPPNVSDPTGKTSGQGSYVIKGTGPAGSV